MSELVHARWAYSMEIKWREFSKLFDKMIYFSQRLYFKESMYMLWENDSCEHVQSYYTLYSVPVAEALWCGIPADEVDEL